MTSRVLRVVGVATVSVVLASLLIAVGFLGRMVIERGSAPRVAASASTSSDPELDPKVIQQIIDVIAQDYVDPAQAQPDALFRAAIQGIFTEGLKDPHSTYITPRDYALSRDDFSGAFQGIGAAVARDGDYVIITLAYPNTPAQKAGLQPGDAVLMVNNEDAKGWTTEQAALKIRGPKGTTVELKIRHPDKTEQSYKLVRDDVLLASVDAVPPEGSLKDATGTVATELAYFRIRSFTSRTPKELTDLLAEATKRGAKGLIIDVRGNPGGLLTETAQVTDYFLDSGTIVSQVDREGRQQSIRATQGQLSTLPLVIVQDEFSASGSEVLAAALRDNGRASVIGSRSFGKGTVNHYRELSNGGAVYVSIARWLTPNGEQIEGKGVTPNVEVLPTPDDVAARRDVAVHRAIELLRAGASVPKTAAR